MKTKIKRVEASLDRQIITGMIISDRYLRSIAPIYHPNLLTAPFAVIVASWCLDYLTQYNKAPGRHIQDIFKSLSRAQQLEESQEEAIEIFLSDLSDEYERASKFNTEYLLDQTITLFRQRCLKNLAEDIEAHLSRGDIAEAEDALVSYRKLEKMTPAGIDPLNDMEAMQKAFEEREEPLFKLPGALGEMLNPHFIRGGFVAFLGRAKVGKTWRLIDIAMRGAKEKCNVAFIQLGDLSQDDYMVRQGIYISKRSNDPRYCGEIVVPVLDCKNNQEASCPKRPDHDKRAEVGEFDPERMDWIFDHTPCSRCFRKSSNFRGGVWWVIRESVTPLGWREAWKLTQQWKKRHKVKGVRLATFPNTSINTKGVEHQLDLWEQTEGFVPDVIILDYPDIMAPDDPRKEKRHQEDERWRSLRRISQERHVCLIVVTQSNRDGLDADTLKAGHTSEDKRKLDHVTAFFSLNQTEEEEERGLIRVAGVMVREGRKENRQVTVLQSLETGQPYVGSFWYYPPKKKRKKGDD